MIACKGVAYPVVADRRESSSVCPFSPSLFTFALSLSSSPFPTVKFLLSDSVCVCNTLGYMFKYRRKTNNCKKGEPGWHRQLGTLFSSLCCPLPTCLINVLWFSLFCCFFCALMLSRFFFLSHLPFAILAIKRRGSVSKQINNALFNYKIELNDVWVEKKKGVLIHCFLSFFFNCCGWQNSYSIKFFNFKYSYLTCIHCKCLPPMEAAPSVVVHIFSHFVHSAPSFCL